MYGKKLSLRDSKILEDHLLGLDYTSGEHHYNEDDTQRIANALCLWLLSVADIASLYGLERDFSMTNLVRWPGRSQLDLSELVLQLKTILSVVRAYDPRMGPLSFHAYKAWIKSEIPDFGYCDMLRPMVYRLYGGSVSVYAGLNTVLQFMLRLTLQGDPEALDEQINEYLRLEDEMRSWDYPETTLDCLSYIVSRWLTGFDWQYCVPTFSSGATAEVKRGKGVTAKVLAGKMTPELLAADGMISWDNPYDFAMDVSAIPTAVGRFVPKGIDRKRFISMEPTVNQYYQYALFAGTRHHMATNPQIHVRLEDQETSRQYCLQGSRDGSWSTIDLSSASDTVTWRFVKLLLKREPDIVTYLDLVRTKYVRVTDSVTLEMQKYAPMGSSYCFPMECLVFASIASYACYLCGIPQNFQVYGDDIVIDSRAYNTCLDLLEELHFIPNRDKSFGPYTYFLEACGMEGYGGYDVTPFRLSRRYDIVKLRKGMSPQQLEGGIQMCNRMYEYGLIHARKHLITSLLSAYQKVPFSVDPERGIYHPNPSNQHLQYRWNRDLQLCEVKVVSASTTQELGAVEVQHFGKVFKDETVRYRRTLDGMSRREFQTDVNFDDLSVRCGTTRDSLREEWIPCTLLG